MSAAAPAHWAGAGNAALWVVDSAAFNGLAFNAHQTWAFRRAELTCFAETPFFGANGKRLSMGHVRTLPPRASAGERLQAIAQRLVDDLEPALKKLPGGARVGVLLCLDGRFDRSREHARFLRERAALEQLLQGRLEALGLEPLVQVMTCGHAGLALGLVGFAPALVAGRFDAALVGGLDSAYDWEVVEDVVRAERIFDGENLDTCIPGEGGALSLLLPERTARRLSLRPRVQLDGVAFAQEVAGRASGKPNAAQGMTRALLPLADQVRARKEIVDLWLLDLTSERYRTDEWQLAFPRVSAGVSDTRSRFELLPTLLGDLGAATLPTALAIAGEVFSREPTRPGASCIASAASVGTERGGLLLRGGRHGD